MSTLEAKTQKGVVLRIVPYADGSYRLDCDWSERGKPIIELPRFYRSERGAKQGAALITGERLTWAPKDAAQQAN